MVGDVFELVFFMWAIGIFAFAPLGYFIYMYTMKSGEPFGDTEPHGDSESKVLDMAEGFIHKIKGLLGKK
ncbi:hypothetical protein [Methyloprofundus sp.]|uniref:hypothetical protein n=1 Tax=Methyloprofundus sp. TaxID=2020875 RepID=UPI003D0F0EAC